MDKSTQKLLQTLIQSQLEGRGSSSKSSSKSGSRSKTRTSSRARSNTRSRSSKKSSTVSDAGSIGALASTLILSGLEKNTKNKSGLNTLSDVLTKDHDGSSLDMWSKVLNGSNLPDLATDKASNTSVSSTAEAMIMNEGKKILGHVLDNQIDNVATALEKEAGLKKGQGKKILAVAAPIVLEYLGKQQQKKKLDTSGLSDLLSSERQKTKASTSTSNSGFLTDLLDKDGDGSVVDDVLENFLGKLLK